MKIALALESFDPQRGEMEAFTFELARRLLRQAHEVHVVAQNFPEAGVEIPIVAHRLRKIRSPLRRAAAAEAELQPLEADVVHDFGVTWYADAFSSFQGSSHAVWQRRLAEAPWWSRPLRKTAARLSVRRRQMEELTRRRLEPSDSIALAFSETVAGTYRAVHGVPGERVLVVQPGVDIKKYSPHVRKLRRETTRRKLGIESRNLLLLARSEGYHHRTWKLVFRAMRRLIGRGVPVHLAIVGERESIASKLAARFGVARFVKLLAPVADRTAYYATADVFLAPTPHGPSSLGALEAAACGLPCIAAPRHAAAELIVDGVDGYVLPRSASAPLADRIESFVDSARAERMSRAARRKAMEHPLDRSVDRIFKIYEKIAEARKELDRCERDILSLPREAESRPAPRRAA